MKKKGNFTLGVKNLIGRKRSSDILGIEFSDRAIKMVHAKLVGGKINLCQSAYTDFPTTGEVEMSAWISRFIKDAKVSFQQVYYVAPPASFISKNVDIPSKDREEIRKIIDLQAGRYTPYSRDEIVIDYLCMDTPGQHYTNVLLVIMNRKVVDKHYQILATAGLEADKTLVASEAMAMTYEILSGLSSEREAFGGLNITEDSTDLTIVDRRQPVFVRSIPVGWQHLTANQTSAQADLIKELEVSLVAYQSQGVGRPVKQLSVVGLTGEFGFLEEALKTAVPSIATAKIPILAIPYAPAFLAESVKNPEAEPARKVSFFALTSALMQLSKLKIDLTPKELILKRKLRESGKDIIHLGILIMTTLLAISIFLGIKIQLKRLLVGKLDAINASTFDQARTLEQTSTKSRVLRNLLENRGKGLYVFEKASVLIGDDIYLSRFSYDHDNVIQLAGTADSMSRVFAFVTELEESNYFKDVKTTQTKSRRESDREVADFEIDCMFAETPK